MNIGTSIWVANSILLWAKNRNIKINPLKLYNLIYLVYQEYLFETQTKIFNDVFQITDKGPVLSNVYFKFNCYGNKPIKKLATDACNNAFYYSDKGDFGICLNTVLSKYQNYSTKELLEINTRENSAYDIASKHNKQILSDEDILNDIIKSKENELNFAKSLRIRVKIDQFDKKI